MNIEVGKTYVHFKGHKIEVLNIAKDSETLENMIVYKHLDTNEIWVRPEKMFFDDVSDRKDNITGQKTRFALCE